MFPSISCGEAVERAAGMGKCMGGGDVDTSRVDRTWFRGAAVQWRERPKNLLDLRRCHYLCSDRLQVISKVLLFSPYTAFARHNVVP